jgi:CHAT domain-containing protein
MKLSQMLLAPVANQLGQKRLLIVSDGALQSIPFAALPIPANTQVSVLSETRRGINSSANSSSRLKTTQTLINSPLERTLAISQGFKPLADVNPYTPLLVQHEIVTLPSASTLAVLRRELKGRSPAAKTVAVIADPVFSTKDDRFFSFQPPQSNTTTRTSEVKRSATDIGVILDRLKYSRTEAETILSLVPATERSSALDFAASRTTATSPDLAQYRMVHFATHGLLNNVHPELSGVVLSLVDEKGADTDGFLRLHDIFNLNLPAELVVLSACETGLGKDVQGEGLVGLTRGFMYAGAKRVAVSLWSVNDVATSELMKRFYQQMLEKGVNPVAALRAAQLEMMKTQAWKAPYYWAAFVVQGEY